MPPEPPCHVVAWAKAHETEVFYGASKSSSGYEPYRPRWEGWLDKAGDGPPFPVPDHDSDAWLAGMVRASFIGIGGAIRRDLDGKWVVATSGNIGKAATLAEALCAAVREQPQ